MRRVETSTATDGDGLASGQMDAMILVTIVAGHREDPQPGDPSRFLRGHRLKTQKERGGGSVAYVCAATFTSKCGT